MAQVLKARVRRSILRSARDTFIKEGYEGCTMRTIAKGAGVTVGNVYRYYKGKEAVYQEIVKSVINSIDELIIKESNGAISFSEPIKPEPNEDAWETSERIVAGLFEIIPQLIKEHKKEVIILLHSSNTSKSFNETFDLVSWIGDHLDNIHDTNGIGRYIASSILFGVEKIIQEEDDLATAQQKIHHLIELMVLKGKSK